jgi:hypothetical protein
MKQFWIEGLYLPKGNKSGAEPFYKSFWALTMEDALQEAINSLPGAKWLRGPGIARISEEQRLRQMGAPELPGLDKPVKKPRK